MGKAIHITNRELRFISLTWKAKNMDVSEFLLYRGTQTDDLKLFKTLEGGRTSYSDYELEINSKYAELWPVITVKKDPPEDREQFESETGKFEKYFSAKAGTGDA